MNQTAGHGNESAGRSGQLKTLHSVKSDGKRLSWPFCELLLLAFFPWAGHEVEIVGLCVIRQLEKAKNTDWSERN